MGGTIPETKIQMMVKQIGNAIEYLHDNGIVLRNFDASGILMTEGTKDQTNDITVLARISNLKKACYLGDGEETIGIFGDIKFRAPEVVQGKHYNSKADSWSFGVILFLLLTGKLPFDPTTYEESHRSQCSMCIEDLILNFEVPTDLIRKQGYSSQAEDLVRKLLSKDLSKRISMQTATKHLFFRQSAEAIKLQKKMELKE